MKKLAVLIAVLFALTCLPLGSMANEDQDKIPNHAIQQVEEGAIPNLTEEAEDKNLNPVERRIVTTDIIRSNASTSIPVQVGQ
jgi:lipopolysaccharide export LptBFGC system permease protein LptF